MATALQILSLAENFSLYFTISIFVIGSIGNFVNLGVFTTLKLFRSNQCAFYLIVESIVDICQLSSFFIIYLLTIIYGYDPGNVCITWCKLRNMIPQIFRLLSTSMVCFAALDQFLSTNPQLSIRQMSTLQLARRLTFIACCLWIVHSIPFGIFYHIFPPNGCIMNNIDLLRYYSFFYYPILHGLLPVFVSSIFSLLAYRNVRRLVRHQVPVIRRRLDRQLTAMIFVRVIFFIILLIPYTFYRIYELNTTVGPIDLYPYAIDQLILLITSSVTNLNHTISFYIFLASSSRYRHQVKYFLVKRCWRFLKTLCYIDPNEVHPLGGISNGQSADIE